MRHRSLLACHRSFVALLTTMLFCSGCIGVAQSPTPTKQPSAIVAPVEAAAALQPSIEAAVRATLVAQAVAATVAAPTPTARRRPPCPSRSSFSQCRFSTRSPASPASCLAGGCLRATRGACQHQLRPWRAEPPHGDDHRHGSATSRWAGGIHSALFAQLKQPGAGAPAPRAVEEVYEPDGGGRITLVDDGSGLTTYVRATVTERGLLVVRLTLPTDQIRAEDQQIRAVLTRSSPQATISRASHA